MASLVNILSERECEVLLRTVEDVAEGEPFWEGDFGLLYNEYVKLRGFRARPALTTITTKEEPFRVLDLFKTYPACEHVALPPPGTLEPSLGPVLMERRSRREYTDEPVSVEQMSTLLHYAAGIAAEVPAYGLARLPLRTFPSHGGLQAPELYLAVRNVSDLVSGIYHYEVAKHRLARLTTGDHSEQFAHAAFDEAFVRKAAAVIVVTGFYERLRWKYGERAYRFMCIDSGFVGQNLYLVAEALGLGACAVSGFAQDQLEDLIDVDGRTEIPLFLMAVGDIDRDR